jgi:signal peptide peptidase SppA
MKRTSIYSRIHGQLISMLPSAYAALCKRAEIQMLSPQGYSPADDDDDDDAPDVLIRLGKIAIINVSGVIAKRVGQDEDDEGYCDLDLINAAIKSVLEDSSISVVILWFNSPGGYVTGLVETGALIRQLSAVKPTCAFTDTLCASAAYELAAQCSWIFATPSSVVGSIGTIMGFMDYSKALAASGITVNIFQSGSLKSAGDERLAMTDAQKAYFQGRVDKTFGEFKQAVAHRGLADSTMQGQCFDADEGLSLNLVDELVQDIDVLITRFSA